MWDIVCQQNLFRCTYVMAFRPTGRDGSIGHIDGYDAS